jgi:uncharacterized protein YjbI with pentapeptide repeats
MRIGSALEALMANCKHVCLLKKGVDVWNKWRREKPDELPDLIRADLTGVNLTGANLERARLVEANLIGANLIGANLHKADMFSAKLSKAKLQGANLRGAYLRKAELVGANLNNANLIWANFVKANIKGAILTNCEVYGVSAWGLELDKATTQENLILADTEEGEGDTGIRIDNIEVAQFVYLLLNNKKIGAAIDTIGEKGVLLLGRFTEDRIAVLERLRGELRKRNFLPMVFDFDNPKTKDFTDTVRLLAGMSQFVIADITKPRSTPLELEATVPQCMIPFATIIEEGEKPFEMFKVLWIKYKKWVFPPIAYYSVEELVRGLDKGIIDPAQERFKELVIERATEMPVRHMSEIIGTQRTE